MMIVLTVLGSVLILAGLIVLFGRTRDASGETRFKYKDIEIASAKPSIVLVVLGTVLVVLPHVTGKKEPEVPSFNSFMPEVPGTTTGGDLGTQCCLDGGSCPLLMAQTTGLACMCFDIMGNMATGTVCK